MVQGPVKLMDADGQEYTLENEIYMLCRCGESSNKPFCDGSHREAGFQAESEAR
jgi:CDGSH-type Zn-finger protein|tara:strand:+ start:7391 stop:7552 length:162 start_codon:yes stop_codon:yes gene_type:complete